MAQKTFKGKSSIDIKLTILEEYWLDDDTYDWMVGKKLSLDISEADPGATLRITTGWWSTNLLDDIPIESAPCKIQFTMTQDFVDVCKTQHLLFTGNGSYTITKFYYEL